MRKRVYLFGEKPAFWTALETALKPNDASISHFSSKKECLEEFAARPCDLLIVDLDGCQVEGLEVLADARRIAPWVWSLAIVEPAGVPCAVKAIKAGACDCLEKPLQEDRTLVTVEMLLTRTEPPTPRCRRALTQMEIQILQMILAGKTSYDMANELHRSKRTIDVHRKNIMRKLRACGLVDLVKRALGMGLAADSQDPKETGQPPANS
ncbi:MAG: hypothetical protein A2Y77_12690 [Planctomycetes bacterium RBG_13_62_9]|nr:MAG: hypothetical protein A2Y77_12690 [Planctomycetes bacterium RBG_13_62_9]